MHDKVSIAPDGIYDDGALHLAMGLSPATLARARRSGELRFTRKGNRTLYVGQWVLDWIKADDRPAVNVAGSQAAAPVAESPKVSPSAGGSAR